VVIASALMSYPDKDALASPRQIPVCREGSTVRSIETLIRDRGLVVFDNLRDIYDSRRAKTLVRRSAYTLQCRRWLYRCIKFRNGPDLATPPVNKANYDTLSFPSHNNCTSQFRAQFAYANPPSIHLDSCNCTVSDTGSFTLLCLAP
jgi:hypothetical protein